MYQFPYLFIHSYIHVNAKVEQKFILFVSTVDVMKLIEHGSWMGPNNYLLCVSTRILHCELSIR